MKQPESRFVRLLLIDDSPGDVSLIRRALAMQPFLISLEVQADGHKALVYLRELAGGKGKLPDLILLDLNLPRMDGFDVLRAIKTDPALSAIPVIIMSSSGVEPDVTLAYERGANSYVVKPISLDGLVGMIHSLTEFWFKYALLSSRA
jgi:two-component system, chemotaxis family, response regulator Rcp1